MSFAYEMGLRGPRCNGCTLAKLKYELGDKFLMIPGKGIYELDAEPSPGQGEPQSYEGRPIRFLWWGMSYQHFVGIGELTFNQYRIEAVRIRPMPNDTWEVRIWLPACRYNDTPFSLDGKEAEAFREWWLEHGDVWWIGDAPPAGDAP